MTSTDEPFLASKDWFDKFRKHQDLYNVMVTGEAASPDYVAAAQFPVKFKAMVTAQEYTVQQVFNANEIGFFGSIYPVGQTSPRRKVLLQALKRQMIS